MKPKTVARILLVGIVPMSGLGGYLSFLYGNAWPTPFAFVVGTAWGVMYASLSVQLIEWAAKRDRVRREKLWSKLKQ